MNNRLRILTVAVLVAAAATANLFGQTFVPAQQPARDNSNLPTTGTASISGRIVTDEATPQPVRRARVVAQRIDSDFSRWTMTDASGRFAINDLPQGRYNVSVTKAGYVRSVFGARRFDRPGTAVGLADGQHVDASMKMLRGAVITGTVRDEFGQAAPNVSIRIMQYRVVNGERTLVGAASNAGPLGESTDDRGNYRLFGLAPGEYVISATPRDSGRAGNLKQITDETLRNAQVGLRQNTTQYAQQPQQSAQPQTPDDGPTVGFTPLYYPGAMMPTDGTIVTVGAGEERQGIDVQLRLVRTAKISGRVLNPDGSPATGAQLTMTPANTGGVNVTAYVSINSAPVQQDGTFVFTGVAPGNYTISARGSNQPPDTGGRGAGGGGAGAAMGQAMGIGGGGGGPIRIVGAGIGGGGPMTLWANADVAVEGQNLGGLTLALQEGMKFSGRIAFEGTRPEPREDFGRARINLLPATVGGGNIMIMGGASGSQVDASGRFTLTGITPGKYRVLANLSTPDANWTLASAIAKGRDMLDFPVDIAPNEDVSNAVLTFTDQSQTVNGSLQDSTGRPAPDYTIVVFPADQALWTATRRIRTARPGTDGKFNFTNLPVGEYRIAALTDLGPNDTQDPSFFTELVPASVAFTLKAGQTHTQNLQIGK